MSAGDSLMLDIDDINNNFDVEYNKYENIVIIELQVMKIKNLYLNK